MEQRERGKLPLLRSTTHGGVNKVRMARKSQTIEGVTQFFRDNVECESDDSVRLGHHPHAVFMRKALPTDEEAADSLLNTLIEIMGWQPTPDLLQVLKDLLSEEMRQTWPDLEHFNKVTGARAQDLDEVLSAPPPWLLLVHWVLLYHKDVHVIIASSLDPVPIYYADMLAALQQQRRVGRAKNGDVDKNAEKCFAIGWTAGPESTHRDRFVPMERPLWPEKRRALVKQRITALPHGETLESIVALIRRLQEQEMSGIVVVAGAGISTSAGVPAFRGSGGLFEQIKQKYPIITEPSDVFSIDYFKASKEAQMAFYDVARELLTCGAQPTLAHWFLRTLEVKGVLKRLYTQNIDNLERMAGISDRKMIQAHGSMDTSVCLRCEEVKRLPELLKKMQRCKVCRCECGGTLKPNIVFYGEELPLRYFNNVDKDVRACQLLIVMGTSLNVSPVNEIVDSVSPSVPCLLINNEAVGAFCGLDKETWEKCAPSMQEESTIHPMVVEQGNIDEVVQRLVELLGWTDDLEKLRSAPPEASSEDFQAPGKSSKAHAEPKQPKEPKERKERPHQPIVKHATFVTPKIVLVKRLEEFATTSLLARYLTVAHDPVRTGDIEILPAEDGETLRTARVTVRTTTAFRRLLNRTHLMGMDITTEVAPDSDPDMSLVDGGEFDNPDPSKATKPPVNGHLNGSTDGGGLTAVKPESSAPTSSPAATTLQKAALPKEKFPLRPPRRPVLPLPPRPLPADSLTTHDIGRPPLGLLHSIGVRDVDPDMLFDTNPDDDGEMQSDACANEEPNWFEVPYCASEIPGRQQTTRSQRKALRITYTNNTSLAQVHTSDADVNVEAKQMLNNVSSCSSSSQDMPCDAEPANSTHGQKRKASEMEMGLEVSQAERSPPPLSPPPCEI